MNLHMQKITLSVDDEGYLTHNNLPMVHFYPEGDVDLLRQESPEELIFGALYDMRETGEIQEGVAEACLPNGTTIKF